MSFSVAEVCAQLGIKAGRLKIAINAGVLPRPDVLDREAALSSFSAAYVAAAHPIVADRAFREATWTTRRIRKAP